MGLLPPLLFLTGASGAGKTTVYQHLLGRVDEAVLIDHDLLWGMDPAHDDPESDYRLFRTRVMAMGLRLLANGRPVMIEGTTTPEQNEVLPHRALVSKTAYCLLVCDDDVLAARLRERPAWRAWSEEAISGMLWVNRMYRSTCHTWTPAPLVLDTTHAPVEETAAAVHEWIRTETETGAGR